MTGRAYRDYTAPVAAGSPATGTSTLAPSPGWYAVRMAGAKSAQSAVSIWFGPPLDPVTGEELDRSWRWQATLNNEPVDLDRVWPKCAGEPISRAEHDRLVARRDWAAEHAPETALADPFRRHDPLTAKINFF